MQALRPKGAGGSPPPLGKAGASASAGSIAGDPARTAAKAALARTNAKHPHGANTSFRNVEPPRGSGLVSPPLRVNRSSPPSRSRSPFGSAPHTDGTTAGSPLSPRSRPSSRTRRQAAGTVGAVGALHLPPIVSSRG